VENPMVNYSKIIADTASNHYNVRDEYKENTYEQNVAITMSEQRRFSVGCINITGELNIGMMIRSACLFGAENFYIFGRKKFDKRSTVGAEKYINIVQYTFDDPMHADESILNQLKLMHHNIVLCEHGGHVMGKDNWKFYDSLHRHNETPLFIFGSESHGIPEVIRFANFERISIPQRGVLRSFNVSAAMNIICWDFIKEIYVFLHSDPSIERPEKIKPILSVDERIEILNGIKYINEIIPYNTEKDLWRLLILYNPSVRFLGDDYKDKNYTGKGFCPVHWISRDHGWSTTKFKTLIAQSL